MDQPKIDTFLGSDRRLFWADATGETLAEVVTPAGSYFVQSYDVLDRVAEHNKALLVEALRNPFTVTFWGSHPDDGNDDCWTGEDFTSAVPAIEAFQAECFEEGIACVMIDGPGIRQIRQNPHHTPRRRDADDTEWQRERAMQAGMGLGVEAYNDEMGCG